MLNKEQKRKRFLRDPLPVRLAGLAADLARVASSARHPTGAESVSAMLEESQDYHEIGHEPVAAHCARLSPRAKASPRHFLVSRRYNLSDFLSSFGGAH